MGQIISFPASPPANRQAARAKGDGAQILFFLGVRYERMAETVAPKARAKVKGAAAPRAKRKTRTA